MVILSHSVIQCFEHNTLTIELVPTHTHNEYLITVNYAFVAQDVALLYDHECLTANLSHLSVFMLYVAKVTFQ